MLTKDQKAGLYVTIIIHLVVIIICLIAQIGAQTKAESSFVLDFTKQEEVERQQKEAEEMQKQLEKLERVREQLHNQVQSKLAGVDSRKNIAVNKGKDLKDDRNTDTKKLYEDADKLQQELKNGYKLKDNSADLVKEAKEEVKKEEKKESSYSGASILSWQLDGRDALKLPTPSYKCFGAGTVTVMISVNRAGKVIKAVVQDGSSDSCLRQQAVSYALRAKFNSTNDPSIPENQIGNIVYEFIAQ